MGMEMLGGYTVYGVGGGVGAEASAGATIGVYPGADTIKDYAGPFNNLSIGAGAALYGSFDAFQDIAKSIADRLGWGGGISLGFGIGASGSVSRTNTDVNSFGK
jgi:hypothetical protein